MGAAVRHILDRAVGVDAATVVAQHAPRTGIIAATSGLSTTSSHFEPKLSSTQTCALTLLNFECLVSAQASTSIVPRESVRKRAAY